MEQLTDLKAILHSKRANIYYLEKCRVMQKDGRVLYLTEAETKIITRTFPEFKSNSQGAYVKTYL